MSTRPSRSRPAWLAGLAVTATTLLVLWLWHLAEPAAPYPPYAMGDWIIRITPGGLATDAIDALGHNAQRLLALATILISLGIGALIGQRRPLVWSAAAVAATTISIRLDPLPQPHWLSVTTILIAGGVAAATQTALKLTPRQRPFQPARRQLLAAAGLALGMTALGLNALIASGARSAQSLVHVARRLRIRPDPRFDAVPGLSQLVTSRRDHYLVDIDLESPDLAGADWRLTIDGAVQYPRQLSLQELRDGPTVERLITLSCISNQVGGPLVSTSRWIGVPLATLLAMAQPQPRATGLRVQAADGYHEYYPLPLARADGALLAFGMNGQLLPPAHGYPARVIVPGRYGMKNTKWVQRITVITTEEDGYWVQRGWDRHAIIRTESRIDTPRDHSSVTSPVTVAGVAWAGDRRISRVEVSVDDGLTWTPAEIEAEADPLAWRRWRLMLPLRAGVHALTVRAADGTGAVQDPESRPPHPSGASGYHRIVVTLTAPKNP